MLKIRLKRTGRKGQPHYRVVVAEAHRSRNSKSIAEIGYYNPRTQPSTLELDKEAAKEWLSKGAQPTETVEQLLVKEGVLKELKRGSTMPQQKSKKKESQNDDEKKPKQEEKKEEPKKKDSEEESSDDSKE